MYPDINRSAYLSNQSVHTYGASPCELHKALKLKRWLESLPSNLWFRQRALVNCQSPDPSQ